MKRAYEIVDVIVAGGATAVQRVVVSRAINSRDIIALAAEHGAAAFSEPRYYKQYLIAP
jgi:hypothetical protein